MLHGFMAMWRDKLLITVLDQPIDTAQQILDRGIKPILQDSYWADWLMQSPDTVYQQLGERADVAAQSEHDWQEWVWTSRLDPRTLNRMDYNFKIKNGVIAYGTHVMIGPFIKGSRLKAYGYYYMSKEKIMGASPWNVWIVNKKWPLHDELAKHLLLYQQVCTHNTRQSPPIPL